MISEPLTSKNNATIEKQEELFKSLKMQTVLLKNYLMVLGLILSLILFILIGQTIYSHSSIVKLSKDITELKIELNIA